VNSVSKPQERNGAFIDPVQALNAPDMQELAQLAVTKFRERSRHYEENCLMPEQNLQELFERGWLTATLSKEIGGKGSNLDTDDPASFLQAIRVVARGRRYLSETAADLVSRELANPGEKKLHEMLSEREFQIFRKLAGGQGPTEIAEELFLSVKTVSTYRARVLEKMNLTTNADLTSYAIKNALLD